MIRTQLQLLQKNKDWHYDYLSVDEARAFSLGEMARLLPLTVLGDRSLGGRISGYYFWDWVMMSLLSNQPVEGLEFFFFFFFLTRFLFPAVVGYCI